MTHPSHHRCHVHPGFYGWTNHAIGIANEGHDAFRNALARAAATSPRRVAVHTLHQHDAPEAEAVLMTAMRKLLNGRAP